MRVTVVRWRTDQIKTLGHLENGYFRYVFLGLVAEDLGQKNNILKNPRRSRITPGIGHGSSFHQGEFGSLKKQKALHRITDERLCSTEGSVALTEREQQPSCQEILRERP